MVEADLAIRLTKENGLYTTTILMQQTIDDREEIFWVSFTEFKSDEQLGEWLHDIVCNSELLWMGHPTTIPLASHSNPTL